MRIATLSASILCAALAVACTGDIEDGTTTDFGDAVAVTERQGNGDIDTHLTTLDETTMLGHLDWRAGDRSLAGQVGDQALQIDGTMHIGQLSDEDLNLFLYQLWEIERAAPDAAHCVSNDAILCCRDGAWSCRARL